MKKFLIIILSLLLFIGNIYAYENEYFKIDIPENYTLDGETNPNTYKWTIDNKYLAVTITDNTELKYNINKFTDEDLENQRKYIEESYKDTLSKYNINLEIKDVSINEEKTELSYYLYYPSKDAIGHDIYQKGIMYTTKNYIITLVYSSDTEINEENTEYTSIKSSFVLLDEPIKEVNYVMIASLISAIIVVFIIFLVVLIKVRKHKRRD